MTIEEFKQLERMPYKKNEIVVEDPDNKINIIVSRIEKSNKRMGTSLVYDATVNFIYPPTKELKNVNLIEKTFNKIKEKVLVSYEQRKRHHQESRYNI